MGIHIRDPYLAIFVLGGGWGCLMDPWIRMFLKDLRDNLFKMVLSIQSPFTPSKMGRRNVQSIVQRNNTQMSLNSVELDSLFWYHIKDFFFFFYDVTLKIKKKNEPSHSVWILKGHSGTSFILTIMKPNYSFTILYLTFSSIIKRNVELTFRKFFFPFILFSLYRICNLSLKLQFFEL